ncbi:mosc domain protein beta barrel domain protein [Teredinibacter turnerae T7901]|uniref:Mosc domain protein beta barrel domain protein n=1 Tax=Teredinibacter turnerae (strain ATCC 39867 / T7901) TaxID=377629 RepID=C5BNF9_TERTT|nr:MOSC N-terminal beta barrel domain-containing protein [Teredinibacter turnerae]ACR13436.1 mosc domain protein beta barrel domain protein [Teredinibacter turnerae T7901]
MEVIITALYAYPIKSCGGVEVKSTELLNTGMPGDRAWMVIDAKGVFISQRKYPRMACVYPSSTADGVFLELRKGSQVVSRTTKPLQAKAQPVTTKVWADTAEALPADDETNQWITEAIGAAEPLRLVRFQEGTRSPGQPDRFGTHSTMFADAAPYLVTNSDSVAALNAKLAEQGCSPVNMRHFRPNIVVTGVDAFAEHHYSSLRHPVTGARLALVDRCQRCSIITVDPVRGERLANAVPFKTLAELNSMPGKPKAPAFGVNAILEEHSVAAVTRISVGETWLLE